MKKNARTTIELDKKANTTLVKRKANKLKDIPDFLHTINLNCAITDS